MSASFMPLSSPPPSLSPSYFYPHQSTPTSHTPSSCSPSSTFASLSSSLHFRASMATFRRFLCALINEGLVDARLLPETPKNRSLSFTTSSSSSTTSSPALVGIFPPSSSDQSQPPLLASFYACDLVQGGGNVLYCDPEDVILTLPTRVHGAECQNPALLLDAVVPYLKDVNSELLPRVRLELESSVANQELSYKCEKQAPSRHSPSIVWERAIIEGHSVHPMHRTRLGMTLEETQKWASEFEGTPEVHFVALPRDQLKVFGNFHSLLQGWLPEAPSQDTLVVPIHEGQWKIISKLFPAAQKLDEKRMSFSQTSLRTVCPVDLPYHMKLALTVYTTSSLRTISPHSVFNGPRVGRLAKLLAPEPLKVIDEVASIGSSHPDPSIAKNLSVIIRENPELTMPDCYHVICAALVEKDANGIPNVISSFGLDTEAKRLEFCTNYVRLFLDCFLPPMIKGLGFEAHGQNSLARFDKSGRLVGFSVRDFGGLKYHPETVEQHVGFQLELLQGSSIVADSMDDVYRVFFHAGIQSHLHRLIRALGQHHNGKGWQVVREQFVKYLTGLPVLDLWLCPQVHVKSLLAMKLTGLYRDFLYYEAPNYIVRQAPAEQESSK